MIERMSDFMLGLPVQSDITEEDKNEFQDEIFVTAGLSKLLPQNIGVRRTGRVRNIRLLLTSTGT